ncbi:hypothetical protein AwDysgo_18230 [Bacteroidales bacterium]|nr:hypothetical protein AwDysgo_18230 [Bacteroidales bacterium]
MNVISKYFYSKSAPVRGFIAFVFIGISCASQAQEEVAKKYIVQEKPAQREIENLIYNSTLGGFGKVKLYDTYLSPIEYEGFYINYNTERMKMKDMLNKKLAAQQILNVHLSFTDNTSKTSTRYSGFIDYSYGLLYRMQVHRRFKIFAGMQANGVLGFIYSDHSGNNPASAKAHISANLSTILVYDFNFLSLPLRAIYQVSSPFVGTVYAPDYGQSYYEISEGNTKNIFHLSSYHNYLSLKNTIALEIPVRYMTLKLAYSYHAYESKIALNETRMHSSGFMIGLSKEFFNVRKDKRNKAYYKRVFD